MYQWCGFKSRQGKNKNLTALKSNSNTVWFNLRTYIYIYIFATSLSVSLHNLLDFYIYIYITICINSVSTKIVLKLCGCFFPFSLCNIFFFYVNEFKIYTPCCTITLWDIFIYYYLLSNVIFGNMSCTSSRDNFNSKYWYEARNYTT